jgi:hypothetical protein
LERGLTRLFILLSIGWCVFVLWYPSAYREAQFAAALEEGNAQYRECDEYGVQIKELIDKKNYDESDRRKVNSLEEQRKVCSIIAERTIANATRRWSPIGQNVYQVVAYPHRAFLFFTTLLILPPIIVYSSIAWLWRGFKPKTV